MRVSNISLGFCWVATQIAFRGVDGSSHSPAAPLGSRSMNSRFHRFPRTLTITNLVYLLEALGLPVCPFGSSCRRHPPEALPSLRRGLTVTERCVSYSVMVQHGALYWIADHEFAFRFIALEYHIPNFHLHHIDAHLLAFV